MNAYQVISRGAAAGTYQAFPDACRLQNGEIVAVFYGGYGHVSLPRSPDWPNGGRLCLVRSKDEGRTWSQPVVIYDDPDDNRDPHIALLRDGTLVVTFFSLRPTGKETPKWHGLGTQMIASKDGGRTWDKTARVVAPVPWYCSAPVRQLPDGTLLLGLYHFDSTAPDGKYGGVIRSTDNGKTWSEPIPIGKGQNIPLDAETDVIPLRDAALFAALRCGKPDINMHYATSRDGGRTWSAVKDIGFRGHAPHLYRHSSGVILLTHRVPNTALHISRDETKTWQGPFEIDNVIGAYPATVELRDRTVLVVYYTEGEGSEVRARRFRLTPSGIELLPWDR
jgi:sialidase-1